MKLVSGYACRSEGEWRGEGEGEWSVFQVGFLVVGDRVL